MKVEVGSIYKTKSYGDLRVLKYNHARDVEVEFIATGYRSKAEASDIRKGAVKDVYFPIRYGVGFIGEGSHTASSGGNNSKVYNTWSGMLERCYYKIRQDKQPTYKGCSVHEIWHNFQNFASWYEVRFRDGYQLDKDLLFIDNKVYSPSTCVLVPRSINNFLTDSGSSRGESPVGVHYDRMKGGFVAQCNNTGGNQKYLGCFEDERSASDAWGSYKLQLALSMKVIMDDIDVRIYPNVVSVIKSRLLTT